MSIPGDSKNKYTHEVKYVRSWCGFYRIGLVLFVLFVVGMLIAIMCNVSNMRRNQREMYREISELRWRLNEANNHQEPMRGRDEEEKIGCGKRQFEYDGHHQHHHPPRHHHRDAQVAHL